MHFEYNNQQVRSLFSSGGNILSIPRYQRDYSWERPEVSEFFRDLLKGIQIVEKTLTTSEYFLGTILLSGNTQQSQSILEVIDGQQRVTTITILLSSISKTLDSINETKLGSMAWKYVMAENDDGNEYRILHNKTAGHYFEYLIQTKGYPVESPIDEEQERIKDAFEYFNNSLTEANLIKELQLCHPTQKITDIPYLEVLKALRDQLLNSNIICISTKDKKSSNLIFEILNGKGKKLDPIDLIKNKIFSYLDTIEPTDFANNKWTRIKNILVSRKNTVEFSTFYRHYWNSKYKKVTEEKLYDSFLDIVNETEYNDFLDDMIKHAKYYVQIISPSLREDFNNRQEKKFVIEYLKYLNEYFNIKQVRVFLLALFNVKEKGLVNNKNFKNTLNFLHQFHFSYSALCSKRANTLENKYSKYAISLNKAVNNQEVIDILIELFKEFTELLPSYEEFEKKFIKLEYSKKYLPTNTTSKYVLNNLEKHLSGNETEPEFSSVEHIVNEDPSKKITLNIGNLLLLEETLNNNANSKKLIDKLDIYKESIYKIVSNYIEAYSVVHNNVFEKDEINNRARTISKYYYDNILKTD